MFGTRGLCVDSVAIATGLADLDLNAASDDELVDVMVAAERLISMATACQLASMAALAERRRKSGDGEFVVDEIATALHLSRAGASRRLTLATDLARLPATAAALSRGEIDVANARVIAEGTSGLPEPVGRAVELTVLGNAGRQTPGQLRARVRRAALSADPTAAEIRHEFEVARRRVELHPLPDGMAGLWVVLAADRAAATYAALSAHARRESGRDGRGIDARRADALVELITGTAIADPVQAAVQLTVPATSVFGTDQEPGDLAGYGPIPASMARRIALGNGWRRVLTDPASGALLDYGRRTYVPPAALAGFVRTRDRTCRFPGCRVPAQYCDLDHTVSYPLGPTSAANLGALCRHHHRLKHESGWTVSQDDQAVFRWTSPTGRTYLTHPPPLVGPTQV